MTQTRTPAGVPTGGQFAATSRPEGAVSLSVPVPPEVPAALVKPVTCRKCRGDGDFQYVSGAIGVCAPCSGAGVVEGDRLTIAARKARSEAVRSVVQAAFDHSYRAAWTIQYLRENEPERFERALASHLAGRPDLMAALDDFHDEYELAHSPRLQVIAALKDWTPPVPGTDTRDGAFDTCKHVAAAYTAHLRAQGLDADWVQVVGMTHDRPDAHPKWRGLEREHWQHYVTRVRCADGETRYVDWTARQFSPEAAHPFIASERMHDAFWETTRDIDPATLDGYLDEIRRSPQWKTTR